MRKLLTKKFRSQGTSWGCPGPGSQKALGLGACRLQILVIWGPNEPPVLVAPQAQAEKLKTIRAWCGSVAEVVIVVVWWYYAAHKNCYANQNNLFNQKSNKNN